MAVDWDAQLLGPVMAEFGEGQSADDTSLPLYMPIGGAAFRLRDAVFDRAYAEIVLDGDGGQVTNRKPCLGVRLALFEEEPRQSDRVYIPSVDLTFVVKDVQEDGHGHAKLMLMVMA